MTPISTGLIGYGLAGRFFHAQLIGAVEGLHLDAVVSSDPDRIHADHPGLRVLPAPQALLDDPSIELVVIAAPNDQHAPLARAALAKGKHVVVEKPFAETLEQARELAALARRADRVLAVFHNRRYDGDFLTLRRVIADGLVGRPVMLESRFDRFRPETTGRWRDQPGVGAGVWFDLGPHLVDQALLLFGPPESLIADIGAFRDGAQVDDDFLVVLTYPRLRVVLRASALAAVPTPRFTLLGDRGAYVKTGFDAQEAVMRSGQWSGAPVEDPVPGLLSSGVEAEAPTPVPPDPGDYRRFYVELAAAIRGQGLPPVSAEEVLPVMAILELARESAATGRRLRLDQT